MPFPEPQPASPKPSAPPALQWLMRVTGVIALLLFLTPTFYVVKYYAVDKPREAFEASHRRLDSYPSGPDNLILLESLAREGDAVGRKEAIQSIGNTLEMPSIGWKRPLECLSAKATLAELATKDADPEVRAAASAELNKVAQNGAVIQR